MNQSFAMLCVTRLVCFLPLSVFGSLTDDHAAGTSRHAELVPALPSHLFASVQKRVPNTQHASKTGYQSHGLTAMNKLKHAEVPHLLKSLKPNNNLESSRDFDKFDGDDLQLDDFLTVQDRRQIAKDPTQRKALQPNDTDWFTIDSTPSPPSPPNAKPRAPVSRVPHEEDRFTELSEQEEEDYEPVRIASGKWACNHKCKDKTRFDLNPFAFEPKLIVTVASIFVAGKVWISRHQNLRNGQPLRLKREKASAK